MNTYINDFLDPESPYFDPNHTFLSSIGAEIYTFMTERATILVFSLLVFYVHAIIISRWLPKFNKWDLEAWLNKCVPLNCHLTMFEKIDILIYIYYTYIYIYIYIYIYLSY